ncbi:MAG: class I SAM-dependent methyltransferase [Pacificimonas sp.]
MLDVFTATVLQKHEARYQRCDDCDFMCAASPHWLEEAYTDAIAVTDTGIMVRNIATVEKVADYLEISHKASARCLDYAGGYGIFVRMMRDRGYDFDWYDPYSSNLLARGFEMREGGYSVVTAMEVMEHVEDPRAFLTGITERTDPETIIFSTETYSGGTAPERDWWYYSFDTGQHIAFYSPKTLNHLADKIGMAYATVGGLHFFSRAPLPERALRVAYSRPARALKPVLKKRRTPLTQQDHDRMVQKLRSD